MAMEGGESSRSLEVEGREGREKWGKFASSCFAVRVGVLFALAVGGEKDAILPAWVGPWPYLAREPIVMGRKPVRSGSEQGAPSRIKYAFTPSIFRKVCFFSLNSKIR